MKTYFETLLILLIIYSCQSKTENVENLGELLTDEQLLQAKIYRSFEETDTVKKENVYWLSIGGYDKPAIESLPPELLNYPNLQVLMIKMASLKELTPSVLERLTQLQELYLSFNELEELPKEIEKLKHLKYLDLEGNNITEFPKEMTQLSKLETIKLGYNVVSEQSIKMMQNALPNLTITGMEGVVIDSAYFEMTEEQGMHLIDSLRGN